MAKQTKCTPWLNELNAYVKENYELFVSHIERKIPMFKVMKMESSYLVWVDIRETKLTSTQVTLLLASRAGVLVENGAHFVNDGEGYIRFNLCTQKSNVLEALERIDGIF